MIVWVCLHSNFRGGLRNTHVFWSVLHSGLQGHPRSLILAPIERAYATSYWPSIVNLVLSCLVSEILQVSCSEQRPTLFQPNFGGVPLGLPMLWLGAHHENLNEDRPILSAVNQTGKHVAQWLDLRVGSSKSTWVDLGLPSGVKSVCSSVTAEIFWRRRSHYKSFQVDFTNNLSPSSSLIQVIRSYRWVWANRAIL